MPSDGGPLQRADHAILLQLNDLIVAGTTVVALRAPE
jgi:hypothetical protein